MLHSDIFIDNNLLHYSYFFFIGSISKRKNLEFLLTAFTKAKENGTIRKDTKLVLGGQNWWGASNVNKMINSNLDIISLGYLSDSDIINLYRYSKAVIFPSIYEGFGMPIIEAMSQNAPLIISDIPTSIKLNERHGNQMFMFKLGNEPSLMKILNNLDKNFESIKSKLNYNDISIYRYENIAKRHLEVYNTLL